MYATLNLEILITFYTDVSHWSVFFLLQYLALGVVPVKLPAPCTHLSFLSLRINFNDSKEISAALCLLRSSPNLRELEILVSTLILDLSFFADL